MSHCDLEHWLIHGEAVLSYHPGIMYLSISTQSNWADRIKCSHQTFQACNARLCTFEKSLCRHATLERTLLERRMYSLLLEWTAFRRCTPGECVFCNEKSLGL